MSFLEWGRDMGKGEKGMRGKGIDSSLVSGLTTG